MSNPSVVQYDGEMMSLVIEGRRPAGGAQRGKPRRRGAAGEDLAAGSRRAGLVAEASEATRLTFKPKNPAAARMLARFFERLDSGMLDALLKQPHRDLDEVVTALLRSLAPPPSDAEVKMAARVAQARAAILREFGYLTRDQLAAASSAKEPTTMVDNWRKRGKVFSVPLPDAGPRTAEVYLRFQFHDGRPLPVIERVIAAFEGQRTGWSLAHWFVGGNGMLEDSARPVDLLAKAPDAVVDAARFDALPAAA
jgi:hypothetical protein